MSSPFIHPLEHVATRDDKPFKTTFHLSPHMLVGLNTLKPGQEQRLHQHSAQDKCYVVLSGQGQFTVGDLTQTCNAGDVIVAAAEVVHGVRNEGPELLSFLTIIAPMPGS